VNKRPGQIRVTTEVGFCPFCARTRTLRIEERQLGALIRTVVACESCHRVLSSTIGVAEAEAPAPEAAPAAGPAEAEPKSAAVKPAAASKAKTAAAPKPKPAGTKARAPAKTTRRTK
jgi:hypothetical protein